MKVGEKVIFDEKGMIVQKTHDATPVLDRVKAAREVGNPLMSDAWHVGSFPAAMVIAEAQKRGVRLDDTQGMQEVLMSLVNDTAYSKFRVKEGRV